LLGVDIEHLSAADGLRVDMVSALRLVIDSEQAAVLSGNQADLGKLNVAVQSLIALLPGKSLPEPSPVEGGPSDPRTIMWGTYLAMRRRGELANPESTYEGMKAEVERLRGEIAALKAGAPAPDEGNNIDSHRCSSSATPGNNVVPLSRPPSPPPAPPRPVVGGGLLTDAADPWEPFVSTGAHYDRWSDRRT
jgi:hypothetical protein